MKPNVFLAALTALAATAAGAAVAAHAADNDALAVGAAKIDLARAIAIAERHTGGTASRAEFERHDGRRVFDVEVVRGKTVTDVKIDPEDGMVIASDNDPIDRDDVHDPAD